MEKWKSNQINEIRKSRSRERNKLDNILFTLSAGTLSLSAIFIDYSNHILIGNYFLFLSWIFLIAGLFSILTAHLFTEWYFKYFENGIKKDLFKHSDEPENNWRNKFVDLFNWISFTVIVFGISTLVYFAYLNVK